MSATGLALALGCFLLLAWPLAAQNPGAQNAGDETAARLKALEERIKALEAEVQSLRAAQAGAVPAGAPAAAAGAPVAAPAPAPAAQPAVPAVAPQVSTALAQAPGEAAGGFAPSQLPVYGGAAAMSKVLNPDISVIGDFLGSVGRNPVRPVPTLEMHEAEAGFQAIIDPYARGDFFISFGEEGVNLEEGYITFTSLPAGLVARAGKMRASFGKVNEIHNHALSWVDRPLVSENLLAGEDGINDAGLSLSRILPAPGNLFLEATGQVFRGDSDELFKASRRGDVSVVGHLRGYHDITESTNLDLGFSYARGHNELGSAFLTNLYGADATLRWKPLRRAIYHSLLARSEFVWSRREEPGSLRRAFGFYTSADYRLNRRWTVGGRYDRSDRATEAGIDSGFSALLTYWPSEFSQIRGQYRFARYAERRDANELRFQFLFSLGAHGAHPF